MMMTTTMINVGQDADGSIPDLHFQLRQNDGNINHVTDGDSDYDNNESDNDNDDSNFSGHLCILGI